MRLKFRHPSTAFEGSYVNWKVLFVLVPVTVGTNVKWICVHKSNLEVAYIVVDASVASVVFEAKPATKFPL